MNNSVLMTLGVVLVLGLMAMLAPAAAVFDSTPVMNGETDSPVGFYFDVSPIVSYWDSSPTKNAADPATRVAVVVGGGVTAGVDVLGASTFGRAMGIAMSDSQVSSAVSDLYASISGQVSSVTTLEDSGLVTLSWFGWEQTCPPNMICILGGFWHFVNVVVDVDAGEVVSITTAPYLISL